MINSKLCGWYACERRGEWLPLTEFGINKSTYDLLNGYCRKCCAAKMRETRKGLKAIRVSKKHFGTWQAQQLPFETVLSAIKGGAHSRSEIKRATKLGIDSVCDCLAVLRFEQNLLQSRVVNGERMFFLRAA